ncbi:hypothetical protein LCGC14_0659730 [marine sediment metagenome]|uniref:Uncharacterized protein n=1 Tax=marine sediment metagenome TaxID=412755 RepID=A0A0F9QYW2_9ZZZZ
MALSDAEVMYNLALGLIGADKVTEGDTTSKQAVLCIRYYTDSQNETLEDHPWNFAKKDVILFEDDDRPISWYDRKYTPPTDYARILTVDDSIGSDVSRRQAGVPPWEVKGDFIHSDAGAGPNSWSTGVKYYDGQFYAVTPDTWVTGTAYIDDQFVKDGSTFYEVLVNHTSDTIAADITAGNLAAGITGTSVTYEVLVTHTSDTVVADITSANVAARGIDKDVVYVEYVFKQVDMDEWSAKAKAALALKLAAKIVVGLTGETDKKIDLINEYERLTMPQARSADAAEGKPRPHYRSEWLASRRQTSSGDFFVT